ncbi:MAG: polysaccharide deacetylase family protein [Burkholderiales bacterium]|nr:polysaccharide deacetylase family protein [Burkholderiales bacterium]
MPPRAVALTFDDGYQDNFTVALPILQRHRLTATFFVCTGYLNDGLMFNDIVTEALRRSTKSDLDLSWLGLGVQALSDMQGRRELAFKILGAVKYLPFTERELACARIWDMADPGQHRPRLMMTDDQVRELAAQGMTIGAHTHTHPILNQVSLEAAREDVEKNRRLLTELIGETPTIFAYPNGRPICDYGYQHVQLIKDLGFSAAVSTAWGIATKACDPYQLPRFAPWDTNPRHFIMRLLKNAVKGQRPTVAPRMASPDD